MRSTVEKIHNAFRELDRNEDHSRVNTCPFCVTCGGRGFGKSCQSCFLPSIRFRVGCWSLEGQWRPCQWVTGKVKALTIRLHYVINWTWPLEIYVGLIFKVSFIWLENLFDLRYYMVNSILSNSTYDPSTFLKLFHFQSFENWKSSLGPLFLLVRLFHSFPSKSLPSFVKSLLDFPTNRIIPA